MRVYLVEDDPGVAAALSALLRLEGYDPAHFRNAEEFLRQLPTLKRGAVVLNILLPGVNGIEAANELRCRGIGWRIVLITGSVEESLHAAAEELAGVTLLKKPFAAEQLMAALGQGSSEAG